MAPLPKRKISKARGRRRRSHNALTPTNLATCPNCDSYKLPHHVCRECGWYDSKVVLPPKAKKADTQ